MHDFTLNPPSPTPNPRVISENARCDAPMPETMLFLTELLGMKVYDLKGRRIGRVRDAGVVPRIDPARVDRFLIGGELNWWSVRHSQVSAITIDGIYLHDEQV